jgi:copper chaperone CopZ
MKELILNIHQLTCEGCNCGHCGQPILIMLKSMYGILGVDADFDNNLVTLLYDENEITDIDIIERLGSRGYEAKRP